MKKVYFLKIEMKREDLLENIRQNNRDKNFFE